MIKYTQRHLFYPIKLTFVGWSSLSTFNVLAKIFASRSELNLNVRSVTQGFSLAIGEMPSK